MASGWDKVTRWAGIGNNREDSTRDMSEGDQQMQDGTNEDGLTPNEASGPVMVADEQNQEQEQTSAELAQLRTERDALQDRLARLQAEFDNARKREEKSRLDVRANALGDAVEPFLGVMDNFGLALKAQGSADQLRSGVELIVKQMADALKSLGVTPVESIGAQFDPRIHEALGSIETAEFPDHQILEEIRPGYRIREKLLRPAMVKIASNPAQVSD